MSISEATTEKVVDYYKELEFDQTMTLDEIRKHIGRKRNEARKKAQSAQKQEIRRKFENIQNLANQAGVEFKNEQSRQAYDAKLNTQKESQRRERELRQARFGMRDFYDLIGLPPFVSELEQIERRLNDYEGEINKISKDEIEVEGRREVLAEARATLLDPEKRRAYDQELQRLRSEQENLPTIPLSINGIEVEHWHELEPVLSREPDEGLMLLLDGEIEGWVRWSLEQPNRANIIQNIAARSLQEQLPLMGLQDLLLYINPERPFSLHGPGERQSDPPTIRTVTDIPATADKHWELFVICFNYIIRWIDTYSDDAQEGVILEKYNKVQPLGSTNIQLERLLFAINPQLAAPQVSFSGIEGRTIDFGTMRRWDKPKHTFSIRQSGRGYLYGLITTSDDWLVIDPDRFEGKTSDITVTIDRQKIPTGAESRGSLRIELVDNRIEPIVIELVAHQAGLLQSLKPGRIGNKGTPTNAPSEGGIPQWVYWVGAAVILVIILLALSGG